MGLVLGGVFVLILLSHCLLSHCLLTHCLLARVAEPDWMRHRVKGLPVSI